MLKSSTNPTKVILIFIAVVIVAAFIGFEAGLAVSGAQVLAAMIFLCVLAFFAFMLNKKNTKTSSMEAARNFATEWWKRNFKEALSRDGSKGFENYFGETKFYGFSFQRLSGYKKGQWATLIVKHTGSQFDVSDYEDSPSPAQIEDPFILVDGYLFRTPIPTAPMPRSMELPFGNRQQPHVSVNFGEKKPEDEFDKLRRK